VTTDRWQRLQDLFEAALELDSRERSAFLETACADDTSLRVEVEALLASDQRAEDVIESAVRDSAAQLSPTGLAEKPELLKFGKYEITGKIGEGGFGMVSKGHDPVLQRYVAIKTCTSQDENLRRRFFREAQIAANLQHRNITTVHDLGIQDGIPFLVQEFLDGEDLTAKIDREETLSLAEKLQILLEVARGLEYAHAQGVLHRDIKPANIRVLEDGSVKIMDFGIAKLLHETTRLTVEGAAVGTVGYLAPEQLRGEELDRRADVFAFGVLAYELMGYRRPFEGDTFSQVSYRLLYEEPQPLAEISSDCPAVLAHLVARCLAKEPEHRYRGFSEILTELEPMLEWAPGATLDSDHLPTQTLGDRAAFSPVEQLPPPEPRPGRKGWPLWVAAAGVALAVVGVAAWIGLGSATPEPVGLDSQGLSEPMVAAQIDRPAGGGLTAHPTGEGRKTSAEPRLLSTADRPPSVAGDRAAHPDRAESPPAGVAEQSSPAPVVDRPVPEPASQQSRPTAGDRAAITTPEESADEPNREPSELPPHTQSLPAEARVQFREVAAAATAPSDTAPQAPSPPMKPGDMISPDQTGVVRPQAKRRPTPDYPQRAQRRHKEARVVVAVLVDETGRVIQTLVKQGDDSGLGFNRAAVEAARQTLFDPATRDSVPGKMWTELTFEFRLK
jgi:serine/threonine-protein kinase